MMVQYGPYLLMGVITVFALALGVLVSLMVINSMNNKKDKEARKILPRDDTLADQIKSQFTVEDERKERFIHTQSGVSKARVKSTRSVFAFKQQDTETGLSLESEFDNGPETPFLPPEEKI